jgi:hypothetical protein
MEIRARAYQSARYALIFCFPEVQYISWTTIDRWTHRYRQQLQLHVSRV